MIARPRFLGALGAILLAGAIGVATLLILGDSGSRAAHEPDSVAFLDPASGELIGQVPGRRTALLRFGDGFLWSMSVDGTLEQIDPDDQEVVQTIGVGVHPGGLAVGEGSVWVTDADSPTLLRIDPRYGSVDPIRAARRDVAGAGGVSVGAGSVWVAQGGSRVLRIEPETGRVEHRLARAQAASDVAPRATGRLGSSPAAGIVRRVDPATNEITGVGAAAVPTSAARRPAAGSCGWSDADRTVWKFSGLANPSTPLASVKLAGSRGRLAYGDGALWATTGAAGNGHAHRPAHEREEDVRRRPRRRGPSRWATVSSRSAWAPAPPTRPRGSGGGSRTSSPTGTGSGTPIRRLRRNPWQWQLEYATCAKLMNHPDAPAPAGWRLEPEVAAARPMVSADGRTYSFRIRRASASRRRRTSRSRRRRSGTRSSGRCRPDSARRPWRPRSRRTSPAWTPIGPDELRTSPGSGRMATRSRSGSTPPPPDLPARMALPYFCAVPLADADRPERPRAADPRSRPVLPRRAYRGRRRGHQAQPELPGRAAAAAGRDRVSPPERAKGRCRFPDRARRGRPPGRVRRLGLDVRSWRTGRSPTATGRRIERERRVLREPAPRRRISRIQCATARSSPMRACGGPSTSRSTGARSPTPTAGRPPITTSRPGCPATATRISTRSGARTSSEHARSLAAAAAAPCSTSATSRTAPNGRASSAGTWRRSASTLSCESPPTPWHGREQAAATCC